MGTNKSYVYARVKIHVFYTLFAIWQTTATNRIGPNQCTLESYKFGDYKSQWANDNGMGLANLLKGEWSRVIESLPEQRAGDICLCVATKLYSYKGDPSGVVVGYNTYYCRAPFWLSFLGRTSCVEIVKCVINMQRSFFVLESDKFYWSRKTKDLYVFEASDSEERAATSTTQTLYLRSIKLTKFMYPVGTFTAIIPKVDLTLLFQGQNEH